MSTPTRAKSLCCWALVGVFFLAGCRSSIPEEVEPYLDAFVEEAAARGHDFSDLRYGLIIQFTDQLPTGKAGSSQTSFFKKEIKLSTGIWKQMNDRQREMLVFHELGHSLLGRVHRDDRLLFDECASIMKEGGDEGCVANIFTDAWRTYYIDELFDPGVDVPDWYKPVDPTKLTTLDTLLWKKDSLQYESLHTQYYGISGSLMLDQSLDYLLTLEYDSLNSLYGLQLNTIIISLSEEDGEFSIKYNGKQVGGDYEFYSGKIYHESPLKLSVIKYGAFYHFFANDVERHIMDAGFLMMTETKPSNAVFFTTYGSSKPMAKLTIEKIEKQ